MTPEQKAKALVKKFIMYSDTDENRDTAKYCALIAVDDRISQLKEDLETVAKELHPHVFGYISGCLFIEQQVRKAITLK